MEAPSAALSEFYGGMRVCVTGGAGFIGSHLCDALVALGAIVSVIDDLSNGLRENLTGLANHIRFIEGSILDAETLETALAGCEIVFHQAAIASVPRSVREPLLYFEVNARGTVEVLEAARRMGVRRVVYAASSSVYGDSTELPKVETMQPLPLSPYASAKFAGEHFLRSYCHCYGLSGISLRYFNIFGPRQRADSPYAAVIPRFVEAYLSGAKPTVFGDGSQTRDFTYVANAVDANLLAGACERELRGEAVNIACGESFSLLELIKAIASIVNVKPDFELLPPRIGEVLHSRASIAAAKRLIGYEPRIQFRRGLEQTVRDLVCRHVAATERRPNSSRS
jgi:UDP-glucose 4-epimerase